MFGFNFLLCNFPKNPFVFTRFEVVEGVAPHGKAFHLEAWHFHQLQSHHVALRPRIQRQLVVEGTVGIHSQPDQTLRPQVRG